MLDSIREQIDPLTKGLTLAALAAYVCGYLVISIRSSTYGFSAVGLLKPQILATGTTFLLAAFLPSVLAHKTLAKGPPFGTAAELATWSVTLLAYYFEVLWCFLLFMVVLQSDPQASHPHRTEDTIEIVAIGLVAVVMGLLRGFSALLLSKHPKKIAAASLVCIFVALMNLEYKTSQGVPALELWFFLTGLFGVFVFRSTRGAGIRAPQLAVLLWFGLVGMAFYANMVYPHINRRWGGGHPALIAYLPTGHDPSKASDYIQAHLLDEEDSGLFIQYKTDNVAVFLPKETYTRLCFLDRAQPHTTSDVIFPFIPESSQQDKSPSGCLQ